MRDPYSEAKTPLYSASTYYRSNKLPQDYSAQWHGKNMSWRKTFSMPSFSWPQELT